MGKPARLHAAGASISHIAARLGANRETVRGWLLAGGIRLKTAPPSSANYVLSRANLNPLVALPRLKCSHRLTCCLT